MVLARLLIYYLYLTTSNNLIILILRMENTQICEQIIKDFNGKKIQGKIFSFESYKYVDLFKKPTRNGNLGK